MPVIISLAAAAHEGTTLEQLDAVARWHEARADGIEPTRPDGTPIVLKKDDRRRHRTIAGLVRARAGELAAALHAAAA